MHRALCFSLVFLSGLTALVYQVTWQSYLTHFLGSHALATSLVLACFFLWLSVGYLVIGRWAHRIRLDRLLLYGVLEGAIGVWGLLSPLLFRGLWTAFLPLLGEPSELLAPFVFTTLFLGPPTFLMGGTIPVLTDALTWEFEASHRTHALIYGVNTAGAVAGALLGGFVLLEGVGLPGTLRVAGVLNLGLLAATWILARSARRPAVVEPTADGEGTSGESARPSPHLALLTVSFLSGFYVFSLESVVIRIAGLSLGTYTYTYPVVVAAFVLAIAVGSLAAAGFRDIAGIRFFLVVQVALLVAAVLLYRSADDWPGWMLLVRSTVHTSLVNHGLYWALVLAAFVVLLLVPVGLMGMNLPLLFNYLRSRREYFSQTVGRVYAVNALGSVFGAIGGGYWLLHHFDTAGVFRIVLIAVGLTLAPLGWIWAEGSRSRRTVALVSLALVPVLWSLPGWPEERFVPGRFLHDLPEPQVTDRGEFLESVERDAERAYRVLFARHRPNGVVHVLELRNGHRQLEVNGKPDVESGGDAGGDSATRTLNALIPLSLADSVDRVFIIGLGVGLSTAISAEFDEVENVRVAEIEQGVIDALPYFEVESSRLDANRDKVEIVCGDAYQILLADSSRYDVILAEPSNPWVTGVAKLFSQEFYREAAARLEDGGLFGQWVTPAKIDGDSLQMVIRTFRSVFPSTSLWASAGSYLLIGSLEPVELDLERLGRRFEEERATYAGLGLDHPLAILGLEILPPATVDRIANAEGPIERLERPRLTYRAGRDAFARINGSLGELLDDALRRPLEPGDPRSAFVLDAVPSPLPLELFAALDAHRERYGRASEQRLQVLRGRAQLEQMPQARPSPALQQVAYLLGEADRPGDLRQLVGIYTLLKNAQFAVDPSRVLGPVMRACDAGRCGDLPYQLLRSHFSEEELRERGVDPPGEGRSAAGLDERQRALLREAFGDLPR